MNLVAIQLGGIGLPVLLTWGWLDVGLAVAVVAVLALSSWILSRARREPDGPWCLGCDYSLKGVPLDATCPECGGPSSDRGAVKARPWAIARASWIVGAWLAAILVLRVGPVCASMFTDTHFRRQFEWELRIKDPFADGVLNEIVILTPGYRIQWPGPNWSRWVTYEPMVDLEFPAKMPVYVDVLPREPGRSFEPLMWIEPGSHAWRLVYPDGSVETGVAIDEATVHRLLNAAGVDTTADHVAPEVAELALAVGAFLDGDWRARANFQRISVSGHVPVGSHHPRRPWWWMVFALAAGVVLHRRGIRGIRRAMMVEPQS